MTQPERELRRGETSEMTVAQLQTQYSNQGLMILRGGEELPGTNRNIWAAYNPANGDTYMFRRTREVSFGTSQEVLDAVGKWVEKKNINTAFQETLDDTQRQADLRSSRESMRRTDERMQEYFRSQEQPAQAATETPAQPAARAAEQVEVRREAQPKARVEPVGVVERPRQEVYVPQRDFGPSGGVIATGRPAVPAARAPEERGAEARLEKYRISSVTQGGATLNFTGGFPETRLATMVNDENQARADMYALLSRHAEATGVDLFMDGRTYRNRDAALRALERYSL